MSSRVSLTSCGEDTASTLVGRSSSDGFTIKVTNGVDVLLHRPVVKTESDVIVRYVETDLGR